MAAVRFGADTVFRSEESTITDEDVDIILERGKAKTKELQEKIQKADKGDLLDFRLDGGISAQTFEGIDYRLVIVSVKLPQNYLYLQYSRFVWFCLTYYYINNFVSLFLKVIKI